MTEGERQELADLLAARSESFFELRRKRLHAAYARRFGVDSNGRPTFNGLGQIIEKARLGQPLTRDEYIIASMGFLPGERKDYEAGTKADELV